MNQATDEYLDQNLSHSSYGVDGRTKPPMSALVKNLSRLAYRGTDEPSHQQVSR